MIWLASFPRSGNTFFRIILHEVYGVSSSTFHRERGRPADPDYDKYAVVKTHLLPYQLEPKDPKIPAVYLVRDGRDALISIAHHRKDIVAPGSDYYTNLRDAILAAEGSFFGGWSRNVEEWLARAAVVIRFEELIEKPVECAERLRPFIDLPPPRLDRVPSFQDLRSRDMPYGSGVQHGFSAEERESHRAKFFRRGEIGGWREEMPDDLHSVFWKLHGRAMRKLGYQRGQSISERLGKAIGWRFRAARRRAKKISGLIRS
jgi:hypothetical protein